MEPLHLAAICCDQQHRVDLFLSLDAGPFTANETNIDRNIHLVYCTGLHAQTHSEPSPMDNLYDTGKGHAMIQKNCYPLGGPFWYFRGWNTSTFTVVYREVYHPNWDHVIQSQLLLFVLKLKLRIQRHAHSGERQTNKLFLLSISSGLVHQWSHCTWQQSAVTNSTELTCS